MRKFSLPEITVIASVLLIFWVNLNIGHYTKKNTVINWDVKSYYAYLPAFFIHNDLSLSFRQDHPKYSDQFWPRPAPNGNNVIITTMGMSFLYAPFFFIGHIWALVNPVFFFFFYSLPYRFMLVLSCIFYLFIGLWYLQKLLVQYFDKKTTAITIATLAFGTNLYFYSTTSPTMSHAYNFALISIFIYLTNQWYNKPKIQLSIIIGIVAGLISLIRPINIIVCIIFILWMVNSISGFKFRVQYLLRNKWHLIIITLAALIIWTPQLYYWKWISGKLLYFSYGSDERFFFANPQLFKILFSFRNGWFIYTPIMFFSILSLIFSVIRKEKFALSIFIYFIINWYILSSWWCWWFGGAFGLRSFIDMYGLMSFPFAFMVSKIRRRQTLVRNICFVLLLFFIYLNLFFTLRYRRGSIHWDSMTKEALFHNFWKLKADEKYYQLLEKPNYEKAREGEYD